MKVTVDENNSIKEKPFPKLMKHKITGAIWLFLSTNSGVLVVEADSPHDHWEYCNELNPAGFEKFNGSITLSND